MLPVSDYKQRRTKINFSLRGNVALKLLIAAAILLTGLLTSQLVFANNLSTDGQKLAGVNSQISELESENTTLKAQIAQISALSTLYQKAQELGFKKAKTLSL